MKPDLFEAPDYYKVDDLLTDEHKLIRNSVRDWVKKSVSPIIEEYAQKAKFPDHLLIFLHTEYPSVSQNIHIHHVFEHGNIS